MDLLPKVSVALRSYNQEEFLRESLDSVLAQNYPHLEIVVADDASTDGSVDLISYYQKKYPSEVKTILHKNNVGHTRNLNSALDACTGKYVAIFDGDDVMLPGKLERQVNYMERETDCVISYHNTEVFDTYTGNTLRYRNNAKNAKYGDVRTMIKYGMFNTNVSNMIRRSSIPAYGADERISIASDWLLCVECLINGGTICYIDEVMARVRRHGSNITKTNYLDNVTDQLKSSFLLLKKHPRYIGQIAYRWVDGAKNQVARGFVKEE